LFRFLFSICPAVLFFCLACAQSVHADTLTISGIIHQSTGDGTGPAVSNPDLNNILDGNAYTLDLSFSGSVFSPGTYDLNGSSLFLRVPVAGAVESAFRSRSSPAPERRGRRRIILNVTTEPAEANAQIGPSAQIDPNG